MPFEPPPPTPRFLTESLKRPQGHPDRLKAEHHIISMLLRHEGNVSTAAVAMDVGRATLNRWIASNNFIAHGLKRVRKDEPTQKEHRQKIDVGPTLNEVSPVTYWYQFGHFKNEDEALGAFKLAYQQGLDGMGTSIAAWMGLTSVEFDAWMRSDALPSRRGRKARKA